LNNKTKSKSLVEEPAFEDIDEYKNVLPQTLSGPDLKVRIPPELMPDEETVMHYFDMYFSNVHVYVPVLNKTLFYQQWHTNREAISPLILEAIFAIAGRLADEPSQGHQWLALASSRCSLLLSFGPELKFDRTCRFFYGYPTTEYASSNAHCAQGEGVGAEAWLLF
jgi:hypothetical protein